MANLLRNAYPDIYELLIEVRRAKNPSVLSVKNRNTVTYGSNEIGVFRCVHGEDHQPFSMPISDMTLKREHPFCQTCDGRTLSDTYNLAVLHRDIANEWDYEANAELNIINDPRAHLPGSGIKVWWKCTGCVHGCPKQHKWDATINHRTAGLNHGTTNTRTRPTKCPECSHGGKSCECRTIANCGEEFALEWNYEKNIRDPNILGVGSNEKCWWTCADCGVDFEQTPCERNNCNRKRGCPNCVNKTEKEVGRYLHKMFKSGVSKQQSYDWLVNTTGYRFRPDFVFEELQLVIELDGEQHFKNNKRCKKDYRETVKNDILKADLLMKHGYTVIRILQEDVWKNKYDWKGALMNFIRKYDKPQCIFLADSVNIYRNHLKPIIVPIHSDLICNIVDNIINGHKIITTYDIDELKIIRQYLQILREYERIATAIRYSKIFRYDKFITFEERFG